MHKTLGGFLDMHNVTRWVGVTVANGFYFYGEEIESPTEGFIAIKNAAMSGGFGGGKGWPGVLRGDPKSNVILDRFRPEDVQLFPMTAVLAIHPSVDLYVLKTTTLR